MSDCATLELSVYPDTESLYRAAANHFVGQALRSISAGGRFTVALSGGSTPRGLYEQLTSAPYRDRVDWSRVYFFWGDERDVPPDNPESNYGMAEHTLLSPLGIPPENVYRIPAERGAEVAADEYEAILRRFFGHSTPRLDLVLLGLGTNGHTASLFPGTAVLAERERWCAAVQVPELDAFRITLTVPVLNSAADVAFLVAGEEKAAVVEEVLEGPSQPERLPAQLICPEDGTLSYWLDRAAAGRLRNLQ